jgi:uncharacterized protein with HEPN domain
VDVVRMHNHMNPDLRKDIERDGILVIQWLQQSKERPEIPWIDVMGIRNHIAHGYFDIDGYLIFETIRNDLDALLEAIDYFIENI